MYKIQTIVLIVAVALFASCNDSVKDEETPSIEISADDAFPKNCVTVYRGESFEFRIKLTDNMELGSFSVEMHHNFDHHTHSTSSTQCEMEPVKNAINPLLFITEYPIPEKMKEYFATGSINIPSNVDTGNYHFMIRVTDASGWQNFEGISVKVADRN